MTDLIAHGYTVADLKLTSQQCDHLAASVPAVPSGRGVVRGLLDHPTILQLLMHKQLGRYLWSMVGRDLVAVRATLFDKTTDSNWRAQWHQDRVIAIRERMDVAGYGPWTTKAGVPHAEAPSAVLDQMLVVRIHLDDDEDNGALRVIPGSHTAGKLSEEDIQGWVETSEATKVVVKKGGVLLMRPLLVHSSTLSGVSAHRRVLHLEFAPVEAISPLQWHTSVRLRRAA